MLIHLKVTGGLRKKLKGSHSFTTLTKYVLFYVLFFNFHCSHVPHRADILLLAHIDSLLQVPQCILEAWGSTLREN